MSFHKMTPTELRAWNYCTLIYFLSLVVMLLCVVAGCGRAQTSQLPCLPQGSPATTQIYAGLPIQVKCK